ncbi:twin-arginine translocase subunit TatC [Halovenus salina]|uniref:Twin-arginine translocase subunit TatC n=1 Tax=Halovenus salina TaxID=1510225 RepID=A0ABD5VU92_9EURY
MGVPLVSLYFISLGFAKLAVLSKRAGEQVSTADVAKSYWNVLAGVIFVTVVAVYAYLLEGGIAVTNDLLETVGSQYRVLIVPDELGVFGFEPTVTAVGAGLLAAVPVVGVALFYLRIKALERSVAASQAETDDGPEAGEPAEMDLGAMRTPAIKAASVEAFVEMDGERAITYAEEAVENDNPEKAQAILDRLDEAEEFEKQQEDESDEEPDEEEDENLVTSTAAGMLDPFTEDETTEDDIGGYYYDIRFILESLTSRAIWIVATFMVVMAGSFMWLYLGGIDEVRQIFFQNMPEAIVEEPEIVVLHPVEALIFMLKFSMLLGVVATVPILLYFAWPAIEERGVSNGDQNVILYWAVTLFATLIGGTALGFLYIAPTLLSLLAKDVVLNNMIVAYRISSFGWLVIYLTVGVGALTMIPVTMVLFTHGNIVSYGQLRERWRGVILAFFAAAGFLSPNGLWTMFIVAIPAALAYGIGLGLCWMYTRVGSRVPRRRGEAAD